MKTHGTIRSLIDEIDAFRAKTGMSRTAFGTDAVGDSNFLPDLEAGRSPGLLTVERLRKFMRAKAKA
jgi:hypothetical protein